MRRKLSVEEFLNIKEVVVNYLTAIQNYYDENEEKEDFDAETFEVNAIKKFLEYQDELLSYDLSDIPAELWQGITIFSSEEKVADFSQTKANIDFKIIDFSGTHINFNGCNVTNLDSYRWSINPKYFDDDTKKANPNLFLSNIFSLEFQEKFYSNDFSMDDLYKLTKEQIDELISKNFIERMAYGSMDRSVIEIFGLEKAIELYKYSKEEYEFIGEAIGMRNSYVFGYGFGEDLTSYDELFKNLKISKIQDLKTIAMDFIYEHLVFSFCRFKLSFLPKMFVESHKDLLLIDINVSEELKERYYDKKLTYEDIRDNIDIFYGIPIRCFIEDYSLRNFISVFKDNEFQENLKKYPEIMNKLISNMPEFLSHMRSCESFVEAVKMYYRESLFTYNGDLKVDLDKHKIPDWIKSLNLKIVRKYTSLEEILSYDDNTLLIDEKQMSVIRLFGIRNLRRLEEETKIFSHKDNDFSQDLELFNAVASFVSIKNRNELFQVTKFLGDSSSYGEFGIEFAKCLDIMRKNDKFAYSLSYDFIEGEFRERHPEIFIDKDAPEELRDAFYKNKITPRFLFDHKEYVVYLLDKNLVNTIKGKIRIQLPGLKSGGMMVPTDADFIEEYVSRFGNERLLSLVSKYGDACEGLIINGTKIDLDDIDAIEYAFDKAVYDRIINNAYSSTYNKSFYMGNPFSYRFLEGNKEFVDRHPDIFINLDSLDIDEKTKRRIINDFYNRNLKLEDIRNITGLAEILKDKNLMVAMGRIGAPVSKDGRLLVSPNSCSDLELLRLFGNEKFLELACKYGRYVEGVGTYLKENYDYVDGKYYNDGKELSYRDVDFIIKRYVEERCLSGEVNYGEDAPDFLREKYPDLFLDKAAPEELKKYFYNYANNYPLSFMQLKEHPEWLPYLEGKNIRLALLKNNQTRAQMNLYFELFGDRALKLGVNRAETVQEMLKTRKVELMKAWYDKTGKKFIPDYIIMQNFDINDADSFLTSASNWSSLMKIKRFAQKSEAREAMLKIAYSFGAFDQDQRGFKKVIDLLNGVPRTIGADVGDIVDIIDNEINLWAHKNSFYDLQPVTRYDEQGNPYREVVSMCPPEKQEEAYNKMVEYIRSSNYNGSIKGEILINLFESIRKEKVNIDFSKDIFNQIYILNKDGSYTLSLDPQMYPKTAQAVRECLEVFKEINVISPDRAHKLFGGFELKYDPYFREFLLKNLDSILSNSDYITYLSAIQKQFTDIILVNSNRTLTLDLAISYVQSNKYTSVNYGNEAVAEVSAIAGYTQADFDKLQEIYNYGKQRVFSSIPRIEKKKGKYTYEMLRLDDPLAMAVGTLTDCCQELGDCAEVCMEHSMVDKNGRVFIIRDEEGHIIAQSWVWRNKDVLCFDNIEIPGKAFGRAESRGILAREVFDIYKQAAQDLIEEDERVYRELLESGKITQEQYDGLRLGKITVGLGFNDIASAIQNNTYRDTSEVVARPLPFEEPVKLSRGMYTNDSVTQYVLEEREDRKEYSGETLSVHSDEVAEYDDSNFTERMLLTLEKLEIITKENIGWQELSRNNFDDSEHLVSQIACNYDLDPKTTRVVMSPNFAIIFDTSGDKVRVAELLFNTNVNNGKQNFSIEDKVLMQMRLAFDQIGKDKEIDVSRLNDKQQEMFGKARGLTTELDIERGVGHGK